MKYMLLFTDGPAPGFTEGSDPTAMYAKVGEWWEAHGSVIKEGHELHPARAATTIDCESGVVTDGPFLEAKEAVGGYAIVEVADLDAAIAMARTWPASAHVEIRPVIEREGM